MAMLLTNWGTSPLTNWGTSPFKRAHVVEFCDSWRYFSKLEGPVALGPDGSCLVLGINEVVRREGYNNHHVGMRVVRQLLGDDR